MSTGEPLAYSRIELVELVVMTEATWTHCPVVNIPGAVTLTARSRLTTLIFKFDVVEVLLACRQPALTLKSKNRESDWRASHLTQPSTVASVKFVKLPDGTSM